MPSKGATRRIAQEALERGLPLACCPWCTSDGDRLLGYREQRDTPKKGDASICITCGGIALFGETLRLERLTIESFRAMLSDNRTFTSMVLAMSARVMASNEDAQAAELAELADDLRGLPH